mgnify:CR=1 FL=1
MGGGGRRGGRAGGAGQGAVAGGGATRPRPAAPPARAPALRDPELAAPVRDPLDLATWRPRTIRRDVDRARALVRRGELTQRVHKVVVRVRRMVKGY